MHPQIFRYFHLTSPLLQRILTKVPQSPRLRQRPSSTSLTARKPLQPILPAPHHHIIEPERQPLLSHVIIHNELHPTRLPEPQRLQIHTERVARRIHRHRRARSSRASAAIGLVARPKTLYTHREVARILCAGCGAVDRDLERVDVKEEVLSVEFCDGQTTTVERVGFGDGGAETGSIGVVGLAARNGPASNKCVGLVRRWESGRG